MTKPVEIRLADQPQMEDFFGAVALLLRAIAATDAAHDPVVILACDQVRRATVALGGKDAGPPPARRGWDQ